MIFWIIIFLMVLSAMGLVCFPLLKSPASNQTNLDSEQSLYKARMAEIQKDIELGRLDDISAEAAKAEEARRLIKLSEKNSTVMSANRNKLAIFAAALCLPLLSIPVYYSTGSPDIALLPQVAENASGQTSIEDLLKTAEVQLAKNPDDTDGWKVVAPVYDKLGRHDDAIKAYKNILRIEGRSPEMLLKLTDAYVEQEKGQIGEPAKLLINEVLEIDPTHSIARYYTGIIAFQSGKPEETARIWQTMIDEAKGNEGWVPVVQQRLVELARSQNPEAASSNQQVATTAAAASPEQRRAMIGRMVANLASRLEDNPDDKEGWMRLVRSYVVLNEEEGALNAIAKAKGHFADDVSFISSLESMLSEYKSNNGNEQ